MILGYVGCDTYPASSLRYGDEFRWNGQWYQWKCRMPDEVFRAYPLVPNRQRGEPEPFGVELPKDTVVEMVWSPDRSKVAT
jgi:hypothetical protein